LTTLPHNFFVFANPPEAHLTQQNLASLSHARRRQINERNTKIAADIRAPAEDTLEAAEEEAKRLSEKYLNVEFVVAGIFTKITNTA
jgi:hypothetical protein